MIAVLSLVLFQGEDGRGAYRPVPSAKDRPPPHVECSILTVADSANACRIALIITNQSKSSFIVHNTSFWTVDELIVKDRRGHLVPLSDAGQRNRQTWLNPGLRDHSETRWIAPGHSYRFEFPDDWISNFDMAPGQDYSVVCHHREIQVDQLDVATQPVWLHVGGNGKVFLPPKR